MVGLAIPLGSFEEVRRWLADACSIGVDSFWLCDPSVDAAVFLGALSQEVEHERLGTFLSAFADRPPVLAWKQIVTVDHLSGGRLEFAVDDAPFAEALGRVDVERLGPLPLQRPTPPMWPLRTDDTPSPLVVETPGPYAVVLENPSEATFQWHHESGAVCILSVSLHAAENLMRSIA